MTTDIEQTALAVQAPQRLTAINRLGREISRDVFALAMEMAPVARELYISKKNLAPAQCAALMLRGYELGFGLIASLSALDWLPDGPMLRAQALNALIQTSGLIQTRMTEERDAKGEPFSCTVWMRRKDNGFEHTITYSMTDAARQGLLKGGGAWAKTPQNMLRWRAFTAVAAIVCPDIGLGLGIAELAADEPLPNMNVNPTTGEIIADASFVIE